MHSECTEEMVRRVKKMRREAGGRLTAQGRLISASYDGPGEMRGYFNVLKLICPNPLED